MTFEEVYANATDEFKKGLEKVAKYDLKDELMAEIDYIDDFSFSIDGFILSSTKFRWIHDVKTLLNYAIDLNCIEASHVIDKAIKEGKGTYLFCFFYSEPYLDMPLQEIMRIIVHFDIDTF